MQLQMYMVGNGQLQLGQMLCRILGCLILLDKVNVLIKTLYISKIYSIFDNVPAKFLHHPFQHQTQLVKGIQLGEDYPKPIVDHKVAREYVMTIFKIYKRAREGNRVQIEFMFQPLAFKYITKRLIKFFYMNKLY